MNLQNLKAHQKMLAVILGVAVIATVGSSLAYAQTTSPSGSSQVPTPIQGSINLPQNILSSVKTSFTTAASTAAGQVTGGQVLSGGLVVQQGYVVYAFKVTDGKSVYSVIVDAGNGQVLKTSQGHPLNMGSLIGGMGGGHGMMMHKHMGMSGSWSKSQTPSGTAPSTTTPSGFQE
ncbi:MAG TPA: PepSY domain-containing protein [Candidatus Nitrosotalea sp.]|nr:PepSY domain-containing protein [Candidatus Nitrosotalea sp.]